MSDEQPLNVEWTSVFKRDYKRAMKRNFDISLLDDIIGKLSRREPLPRKNQDHPLHNNWDSASATSCLTGCSSTEFLKTNWFCL